MSAHFPRPRASARWALAALVAFGALGGCGPDCRKIAALRSELSKPARAHEGPHARVALPLRYANERIAVALAAEPIELPVLPPSLGALHLPGLDLKARASKMKLSAGRAGRLEAEVEVEIVDERTAWLSFLVVTDIEPKIDKRGSEDWLVVRLGAEDIESIEPRLPRSPLGNLVRILRSRVAAVMPTKVPTAVLEAAARKVLHELSGNAWRRVRGPLFGRLGQRTVLEMRLPELPLGAFSLRTTQQPTAALVVDIDTNLPGAGALSAAHELSDDQPVVFLSATTAVALANWAIDKGLAPKRYSRDLKPRADGDYRPVYAWLEGGERPLQIHIFRERGGCSYLRVALVPRLRLAGPRLVVELRNRRVEEVEGSIALELGGALSNLLGVGFDRSRSVASEVELQVGGQTVRLELRGAELRGSDFAFRMEAVVTAPAPT